MGAWRKRGGLPGLDRQGPSASCEERTDSSCQRHRDSPPAAEHGQRPVHPHRRRYPCRCDLAPTGSAGPAGWISVCARYRAVLLQEKRIISCIRRGTRSCWQAHSRARLLASVAFWKSFLVEAAGQQAHTGPGHGDVPVGAGIQLRPAPCLLRRVEVMTLSINYKGL